jgi:hypothetical protein
MLGVKRNHLLRALKLKGFGKKKEIKFTPIGIFFEARQGVW